MSSTKQSILLISLPLPFNPFNIFYTRLSFLSDKRRILYQHQIGIEDIENLGSKEKHHLFFSVNEIVALELVQFHHILVNNLD
ncbi:uncharacterized protein J3R85_012497 [Psidium guajava]|nr:uncharacterized protein J3R85_012497 [Psidium guajava]